MSTETQMCEQGAFTLMVEWFKVGRALSYPVGFVINPTH